MPNDSSRHGSKNFYMPLWLQLFCGIALVVIGLIAGPKAIIYAENFDHAVICQDPARCIIRRQAIVTSKDTNYSEGNSRIINVRLTGGENLSTAVARTTYDDTVIKQSIIVDVWHGAIARIITPHTNDSVLGKPTYYAIVVFSVMWFGLLITSQAIIFFMLPRHKREKLRFEGMLGLLAWLIAGVLVALAASMTPWWLFAYAPAFVIYIVQQRTHLRQIG